MNEVESEELKGIKKRILLIRLVCLPGPMFLGFGYYGLAVLDGDTSGSFLPILGNATVSYSVIAIGALTMAVEFSKLRPLWKRQRELKSS
ncbi:hypothetical protein [Marinobacter sp. V034]|uniref:hypothetical protein n=1 Tax=Marinobacter sp. V034 TaxID=3459610 RepID=UPI004043CE73